MPSPKDVSPLESMLYLMPDGHDDALRQALYNTAATVFAVILCAAAVVVYYILEVFLKPLLWAVLCGAFLHPFKHTLTHYVTNWLNGLRRSGTPLLVGTAVLPVKILDTLAELLCDVVFRKLKFILIATASVFCLYIVYNFAPIGNGIDLIIGVLFYTYKSLTYFETLWVSCCLSIADAYNIYG